MELSSLLSGLAITSAVLWFAARLAILGAEPDLEEEYEPTLDELYTDGAGDA